jgi:glycosyltransferase involved in cell wall biosynthesis
VLLVVLNGCTDGTAEVVEAQRRLCPQVRSLVYPQPLGKGGAVLEGLCDARGARIAVVDADNMVGPEETARLVDALDGSDIAIGWRRSGSSRQPLLRRLASLLVRLWTRWFLGLPYHDTQCGAKALRGEAAALLAPRLRERGWALDVEMLVAARCLGLRVVELPVAWNHVREGSKLHLLGAGWEFLCATWRLRWRGGGQGPP